MKLFKKILAPVDFSAISKAGIQRAIDTAVQCNSDEIHLLSVVDLNTIGYLVTPETGMAIDYQTLSTSLQEAKMRMLEIEGSLPEGHDNITFICKVEEGELTSVINDYILKNEIDLLIMGTAGTQGIREFIFGSNAQRLASEIPCPVLTLQPYGQFEGINKMIVPVEDFYPENKLQYAITLAGLFHAEIHLVCLQEKLQSKEYNTFSILVKIKELLSRENIPFKTLASGGKNITDAILRYAEKESIDLILVNPGEESKLTGKYIESTGGQIVNHAQVPVLTIKKNEQN